MVLAELAEVPTLTGTGSPHLMLPHCCFILILMNFSNQRFNEFCLNLISIVLAGSWWDFQCSHSLVQLLFVVASLYAVAFSNVIPNTRGLPALLITLFREPEHVQFLNFCNFSFIKALHQCSILTFIYHL
jgi:hypothetical protein